MNGTNYKLVFVMLSECLISIKSGDSRPRNIGDFMPDYNLWYAIKFMAPEMVIVLENKDLTRSPWGLRYDHVKFEFITKWLSQVIGLKETYLSYSPRGDWRSYCFPESEDILETVGARGYRKLSPAVFIDSPNREGETYIREHHPHLEYIDKTEFIKFHNKNPRIYEKKSEIECKKQEALSRILGGGGSVWNPIKPGN